jgi:stage II sporulation protein D
VPRSDGDARSTPLFRIVRADGADVVLDGFELRRRLSPDALPSPRFAMRLAGGQVVCEGRGHGHGVGLCQWGAAGQAEAGRSALDILRHYYPGLRFVRLEAEK